MDCFRTTYNSIRYAKYDNTSITIGKTRCILYCSFHIVFRIIPRLEIQIEGLQIVCDGMIELIQELKNLII